ncbi:transposon Tf2-11 polyprotein [Trichonephila clavipes]|nr:transposon Tf2-11 polyprotein [Trichonephila clavipes]
MILKCESTFAPETPKSIIESVTKYNYIVAVLHPGNAPLVRHILMHPDVTDPYAQKKIVRKSSEPLEWNENAEQAFPTAKSATAEATFLRHPIPGAQWADSSRVAIDTTLSQSSQETWEPFLHET